MNAEIKPSKSKKRARKAQDNITSKRLKSNTVATKPATDPKIPDLKKKKSVKSVCNGKPEIQIPESSATLVNNISRKNKKKKKFRIIRKNLENSAKPVVEKKTIILYPKADKQFSSNWKKLLETMEKPALKKSSEKKRKTLLTEKSKTVVSSPKIFKDDKSRRIKHNTPQSKNKPLTIWFDDVDPELLETNVSKASADKTKIQNADSENAIKENILLKSGPFGGLTKFLSMDCEMVGTGDNGQDSVLARVSIVNTMGQCVYDKFVKPRETVTDYRTAVSGVRPSDLEKAEDFVTVQKEVSDLLDGRCLVGHAVYNDLKVLFLSHPKGKTRDTSTYKPFRQLFGGSTPSLKRLADKLLNVKVQDGEHSSIQDAQAAMRLYTMFKKKWESDIKQLKHSNRTSRRSKTPNSPGVMRLSQLKI